MATCVLYVDESGDIRSHNIPLRNAQTPLFVLTGLALPLQSWRDIDRDYLSLKRNFFSPELARSSKRPEHFEIKGRDLAAPRHRNSRRRHAFLKELFDLVLRYDGKLFCVSIIKSSANPASPTAIYTSSLQYMVERFNSYIAEHPYFDKGIIIADSTKRFDWDVAVSHMSFIFGTETGRQLTHIYEAPLFADSQISVGLQIVDNCSSAVFTNHYHYYCRSVAGAPSYGHMQDHWDKIKSLEFVSRRRYEGHIRYGFRVIRHDQ